MSKESEVISLEELIEYMQLPTVMQAFITRHPKIEDMHTEDVSDLKKDAFVQHDIETISNKLEKSSQEEKIEYLNSFLERIDSINKYYNDLVVNPPKQFNSKNKITEDYKYFLKARSELKIEVEIGKEVRAFIMKKFSELEEPEKTLQTQTNSMQLRKLQWNGSLKELAWLFDALKKKSTTKTGNDGKPLKLIDCDINSLVKFLVNSFEIKGEKISENSLDQYLRDQKLRKKIQL